MQKSLKAAQLLTIARIGPHEKRPIFYANKYTLCEVIIIVIDTSYNWLVPTN